MQASNSWVKRTFAILSCLLLSVVLLFTIAVAGLYIPFVQRFTSSMVNDVLLKKNINLKIERITLGLDGKIQISHPEIITAPSDTILYAGKIKLTLRLGPLIAGKISADNISVQDAIVNLSTDSINGRMNILDILPERKTTDNSDNKNGKMPDIGIGSVSLKNIRFTFTEHKTGTRIFQNVKNLKLDIDKFSLSDRVFFTDYIELEGAAGGMEIYPSSAEKEASIPGEPFDWVFRLSGCKIRDISFTVLQPHDKMEFSLRRGILSGAEFEPAKKRLKVSSLFLEGPGTSVSPVISSVAVEPALRNESVSIVFPGPWEIIAEEIKIREGFFQKGYGSDVSSGSDISSLLPVTSLSADFSDFKFAGTGSKFTLSKLCFGLGEGFVLKKGEIDFRSDSTAMTTLLADIQTETSRIKVKLEAERELPDIIKYWKEVPFSIEISETEVSYNELSYFIPGADKKELPSSDGDFKVRLACIARGTSAFLDISSFRISTPKGSWVSLDGQLHDIFNSRSAQMDVNFQSGQMASAGLNEILRATGSAIVLPDFDSLVIHGNIAGSFREPQAELNITGPADKLAAAATMNLPEKTYNLKISYTGEELVGLAQINDLTMISGSAVISGKEFIPEIMSIMADISIDSIDFRGYCFNGIFAELEGDEGLFNFNLKTDDRLIEIDLAGTAGLKEEFSDATIAGTFKADGTVIDFFNGLQASGALKAEASWHKDDLDAGISFDNFVIKGEAGSEEIDRLTFSLKTREKFLTGRVNSDFLNADMWFPGSVDDLELVLNKNYKQELFSGDSAVINVLQFASILPGFDLNIKLTYDPIPGIILNDPALSYGQIELKIKNDTSGIATAEVSADNFSIGQGNAFGLSMLLRNQPDSSVINLKADSLSFGDISIRNMACGLFASPDTLQFRIKAGSRADSLLYDIAGAASLSSANIRMASTQNHWTINGIRWEMAPGEFLVIESAPGDLFADIHWSNGEHTIDLEGRKSEDLTLRLGKVWLNMLLPPGVNMAGSDGELSGMISYSGNNGQELGIQMDVRQMRISDELFGDLKIEGYYVSDSTGRTEGSVSTLLNEASSLNMKFNSNNKESLQSITSEFSAIPLNLAEPFISRYVSGLDGEASGRIAIISEGGDQRSEGEISVMNTNLKVIPLNARYYLKDDIIRLEDNQLRFRSFSITDSLNNPLSLNGTVDISDLQNIRSDLVISSDHLQVMNTTPGENPAFNGSVFIDSKLIVTGPVKRPSISGSVVLAKGSTINYRLVENLSFSETEKTITFASLSDDTTIIKKPVVTVLSRVPDIETSIEINPGSLFRFEISRGFDIAVEITGGGFLNYALLPNKVVSLSGTYEINEGSAELRIPGWPRKNFMITPGSFVKWDGPVDDPQLNIETTSNVKGSYYNPVDSKNREVSFIVQMKIFNNLSNLEVGFDVTSNDQYLTSIFSTLSKDERMKQAINLLIFGSVELPNLTSSSGYVTQQINQFWESQLNQLTRSAFKGIDLSFGLDTYTGISEGSGEQKFTSLTYELKKDFLNERGSIVVSGRVKDPKQEGASGNSMIDNFIFEYALDTNRTKFFKVYREQNYEDILEGEVIKSGLGFVYRKSFNKLSEIWRRNRGKAEKVKRKVKRADV